MAPGPAPGLWDDPVPMELRQLRYFVAVAETRNFTRASEQLHIAQPPLSRQIQLLEAELGVQLLLRNSRPVRLTDAGRLFYEQALQVLARIESMKSASQQLGLQQRRRLTIGFVPSALYGGLPVLIRRLRQHFPDLDIQMVELTTSLQQVSALQAGRIDVGVGRIRSADESVARIVLGEEKLVLAAPIGHRLVETDAGSASPASPAARRPGARLPSVSLAAIAGQRLIVYPKEPRPSFADHVLSLLRDQSIRPREITEVRELQTALGLVAAETGVCLIPSSARIRTDVVYHEVSEPRATSPIILIHRLGDTSWYVEPVRQLGREVYGALAPLPAGEADRDAPAPSSPVPTSRSPAAPTAGRTRQSSRVRPKPGAGTRDT